jgi:hypothetical protein
MNAAQDRRDVQVFLGLLASARSAGIRAATFTRGTGIARSRGAAEARATADL